MEGGGGGVEGIVDESLVKSKLKSVLHGFYFILY